MSLIETFKKSPKPFFISIGIHFCIGLAFAVNVNSDDKPLKQSNFEPIQARVVTDAEMKQFQKIEDDKKQKKLDEKRRLENLKAKQKKIDDAKKKRLKEKKLAKIRADKQKALKKKKEKIEKQKKIAKALATKKEKVRKEKIKQQQIVKQKEAKRVEIQKKKAVEKKKQLAEEKAKKIKVEKQRLEQEKLKAAQAKAEKEKIEIENKRIKEEKRLRLLAVEEEKKRLKEENRLRLLAIEEENKRFEAESKRLAEIAKKQAIAKQKAEDERLRKENELRNAKRQQLLTQLNTQYVNAIQKKITKNWRKPSHLPEDFNCELFVSQLTTGDVISVRLGVCNGDALFKRSVEDAAWRASPLPLPADAELYQRNIEINFNPKTNN